MACSPGRSRCVIWRTGLWARRYNGPAKLSVASSVAVSPDGTTVCVTGQSYGRTGYDCAAVAYRG